jgi:PBP1b-binding outer membrane lipoprotein LpoB
MFLKFPHLINILGAENDSKQYSNNFKFLLNSKYKKKSINNFDFLFNKTLNNTLVTDPTTTFSSSVYNTESNLKFKDYKSSNAQFLGSERTPRLLNNLNSSAYKWNTLATSNVITSITNNLLTYGKSQEYTHYNSLLN